MSKTLVFCRSRQQSGMLYSLAFQPGNHAGALPYKTASAVRCFPAVLSYDTCKFDNLPPGLHANYQARYLLRDRGICLEPITMWIPVTRVGYVRVMDRRDTADNCDRI